MDPSAAETRTLRPTPERRRHDQTYKRLFSRNAKAALVALVRDFAAEDWADELDFSAIEPFPTETVGPDLQRRLCDSAWRIRSKNGGWVVFLLEFQSSKNPGMVIKTLRYSEAAHAVLHETERNPDGGMPFVFSYVVYAGAEPWTAETTLAGLARRGEPSPAMARAVAGLGTTHGYRVLDLQAALAQDLLPEDSVLYWVAALEKDPWRNFPSVHRSMAAQWGGPEFRDEREAFADWTDERMRVTDVPEEVRQDMRQQIIQPKEEEEMQTYTEWAEGHRQRGLEQGREEGHAEGHAEGQRAALALLVVRQAARRFGREVARQLEGLMRSMGVEQLARVGDAVVDCDTADEFLAVAGSRGAEE